MFRNAKRNTSPPELGRSRSPLVDWIARRVAALRASRALALPALGAPSRRRLRAPCPGRLSTLFAARLAARAGIPLQAFLQHRLARHLANLPVPAARLPVALAVEDGALVARPGAPAPSRRAPSLESFLRAEGPAALGPEIQLAHADVARIGAQMEAQRQLAEAARREVEEANRAAIADPADEAQASRMGRPQVPPPFGLVLQLLALAFLLAEAWQLTGPYLATAGIGRALQAELRRDPLAFGLAVGLGLGSAVSLVLCADLALRRARDLIDAPQNRWLPAVFTMGGAVAAALGLAGSLASMRAGPSRAVELACARVALVLAVLAIPFTIAWMLRLARELDAVRDQALASARAWEAQHYRALADLARRAAALREEERRAAQLEAERALAVQRLRMLQHRAQAAERLAADAAEEDEADLARIAQSIAAALERDRYAYLRQAAARGLPAGRGGDPRPAPARPAPAGVGESLGLAG
jgi:hypothetical protein